MKSPINVDLLRTPLTLKIAFFFILSITFFYLGKHWSDGYQQLIFFTTTQGPNPNPNPNTVVTVSPNYNKSFNVSALIDHINQTHPPPENALPPPPPPPDSIEKLGIVNENGTMSDEFEVGDFNPAMVDDWVHETQFEEGGSSDSDSDSAPKFAIKKFGLCPRNMSEYIPCLDNADAIRMLKSTEKGERFERHCPEEGRGLNCLVPAPKGYRTPIPWPRSRDEVPLQ